MLFPKTVLVSLVFFGHAIDARHLAQRDSAADPVVDGQSELFANFELKELGGTSGQPSCRLICGSCGSSCSATTAAKRDLLELATFNITADDKLLSPGKLQDTNYSLFKRTFKNVRQTTIGSYLKAKVGDLVSTRNNPNTNLIDLDFSTELNDYTFAVLRPFSNFDSNILNIGIEGLTGCTVLTIVSQKAVYMAHFYENLAFRPDGGKAPDTAFEENCLNLITGKGQKWRARGANLDPDLFKGANGPATAYIMTPRQDQETPTAQNPNPPVPGPDTQFYPGRMDQLSQTLTNLIPGLEIVYYNYIAMSVKDHRENYQGRALFEYDPNADGSNNPNFRLWYEHTMVDGRGAGLIKIPIQQLGVGNSLPNSTTKYGLGRLNDKPRETKL